MTNTYTSTNPLGSERIGKLIIKFAVPSIISLVFNSIYNIVDQIFVGQKIGYLGNAATNVIFPLTVLGIALSIMFGDGGAAFVSLRLGRGDKTEASKGAGTAVTMSGLMGIFLCIVISLFLEPVCRFLGATEPVMPYAVEYGRIIALGLPFSMFAGCGNALIRSDGRPRLSMLSMIAGALTNIILDPIFIFGFDWGMAGAAWATIIGQFLSAAITFVCLRKTRNIKITRAYLVPKGGMIRGVAGLGISSFITQAAIVVIITLQNNLLTRYGLASAYGAEIPLAAHGITMKVNQIVMSICLGLASGCQPIMGFNYGAGQYDRVRKTILRCIAGSVLIMAAATMVYQLRPMAIVRIFGSESELYNTFAAKSFRIFLMASVLNGFHICTGIFFQSIGKPLYATVNSLARQVLFIVPASIICCRIIGVEGVLWAGPLSDVLAFLIAFALMMRELDHLKSSPVLTGREILANG
ncbi:MATE family efflux transporter [Breznakiella homolactica]|uniref:Multidrug export protein MepA n=1 Tax=Breznakiella homolactica TaxID=2798577 RepID=A0A7T7XJZ0_9SPIR|nr:MATE family efflux transporter [Breznakiella homolactica]QQO07800.1 MATE family efflux transporter [Breznakiella homolactica]